MAETLTTPQTDGSVHASQKQCRRAPAAALLSQQCTRREKCRANAASIPRRLPLDLADRLDRFLTVAQSKLATYLWPAFPPLAILAAVAWTRLIDGWLGEAARRSFARAFVCSSWGGPIVLPAAVAVLQWVFAIRFGWPAWVAVGLVAAASPLPLIPWHAGRRQASMAAAALSLAAQFVVVMTLILPRLAETYSARDLAEHFNRRAKFPSRLLVAEERIGSLVFYLDPRLRAGLTEDQVQYLPAEPPTPLRRGDVVAIPERKLAKVAEWLDLGDNPYEPVGRYRLYHIAKPQAAWADSTRRRRLSEAMP